MQEVVSQQTLAQAKVHLDAARALETGGRASRADVMAAEAQVANGEQLVDQARSASEAALDRLKRRMRDDSERAYEIGEALPDRAPAAAPRPLRDHYRQAMKKRPELEILEEQARALERQRKAAVGGTAPRLDAFGNLYYSNPNQRVVPQVDEFRGSWDVGVQLSWSPNDVPTSLAQASGYEARRAELIEQAEELRDTVRDEVRDAYFALKNARTALATTERSLAAAEEAYRVRVERFRYGRASAVELADSEVELFRARLARIDAQVGLRVAEVRIAHATGR
jgi:outer membrane protein TolC